MKLVVGLGTPGKAYQSTRHNAGWMALDLFAKRHGATFHRACLRPLQTAKSSLEGVGNVLLVTITQLLHSLHVLSNLHLA